MITLEGKIALVTGGGRGLGAAIVQDLAAAGMTVLIADIREDLIEQVMNEVINAGGRASGLHLDVTNAEQTRAAVAEVLHRYERIDVLVNNAGVDVTISVEELAVDDWDRVMAVNLRAPFLMAKHVMGAMRERGEGHIINIVSTAAKRAWPNAAAYHASKWGLLGLSHALHTEARPHGVKVTAVIAGGMRTPFLLDRFPDIDIETLQDPRNVAATVRFVLMQPAETVIPEIMVLPMRETSWP
ncbi:MAG: SDR family oxidoreductase [Chloroflexaceae bacterium]|nr:SDR family oxidoreductase [Chloroflexaceae bacterium]NJO04121.1 SDR family oxidoreductase [Chloroflexaceae bacterium]